MIAFSAGAAATSPAIPQAHRPILPVAAALPVTTDQNATSARAQKPVFPPTSADRLARVGPTPTFEISHLEAVRLSPTLYAPEVAEPLPAPVAESSAIRPVPDFVVPEPFTPDEGSVAEKAATPTLPNRVVADAATAPETGTPMEDGVDLRV